MIPVLLLSFCYDIFDIVSCCVEQLESVFQIQDGTAVSPFLTLLSRKGNKYCADSCSIYEYNTGAVFYRNTIGTLMLNLSKRYKKVAKICSALDDNFYNHSTIHTLMASKYG